MQTAALLLRNAFAHDAERATWTNYCQMHARDTADWDGARQVISVAVGNFSHPVIVKVSVAWRDTRIPPR